MNLNLKKKIFWNVVVIWLALASEITLLVMITSAKTAAIITFGGVAVIALLWTIGGKGAPRSRPRPLEHYQLRRPR